MTYNNDLLYSGSEGWLADHLTRANFAFDSITELGNNEDSQHYVWRVSDPSGYTTIFKRAKDGTPLSNEVAALTNLSSLLSGFTIAVSDVKMPELVLYDDNSHVLQLSDVRPRTLHEVCKAPDANRDTLYMAGRRLGAWLAMLHMATEGTQLADDSAARARAKKPYLDYANRLRKLVFDEEAVNMAEVVGEKYARVLDAEGEVMCHGSFGPSSVVVNDRGLARYNDESTGSARPELTTINFASIHRGSAAIDLGQFAAEAYVLKSLFGNQGLLNGFLSAYCHLKSSGMDFGRRMAVHCGVHLVYWSRDGTWCPEGGDSGFAVVGFDLIRRVERGQLDASGGMTGDVLQGVVRHCQ